jgi:hypothetical protein
MSNRANWQFLCEAGVWSWRLKSPDTGVINQSDRAFQDYSVCIEDAERFGYVGMPPLRADA